MEQGGTSGAGRRRGPALWPPVAESGQINGFQCRLTDGKGGLVFSMTSASSKQLKLPKAVSERPALLADKLGVRVEDLPTGLLTAIGIEQSALPQPPQLPPQVAGLFDSLEPELDAFILGKRKRQAVESFSPSKGWSPYETGRVGARHSRVSAYKRRCNRADCAAHEAELEALQTKYLAETSRCGYTIAHSSPIPSQSRPPFISPHPHTSTQFTR